MNFGESVRLAGAKSLAVFGDSITVGLNASRPELAWPVLLAQAIGIDAVRNHGISGTVLQRSLLRDGKARAGNGRERFEADLLAERADVIAILYGYNDARYVAAPSTFNVEAFRRDFSEVLAGILAAGHAPAMIAIGSPCFIPSAGLLLGSAGFAGQTRAGFELYVEAVRSLAVRFRVMYAPVYETMAACGDGALASEDVTHPNDAGHRVIAQAFERAALV